EAVVKEQPVVSLRLFDNGRPVPDVAPHPVMSFGKGQPSADAEWTIILPAGTHQLNVLASAADTSSFSPTRQVDLIDPATVPVLHLLAIGIEYQGGLKLRYPAKDAGDVAEAFQSCEGTLFKKVSPRVLVNQDATTPGILMELDALREKVKQ